VWGRARVVKLGSASAGEKVPASAAAWALVRDQERVLEKGVSWAQALVGVLGREKAPGRGRESAEEWGQVLALASELVWALMLEQGSEVTSGLGMAASKALVKEESTERVTDDLWEPATEAARAPAMAVAKALASVEATARARARYLARP